MPYIPFVSGMSRSGTTLLRLMLDAHSQLAFPPEIHFLPRVVAIDPAAPDWLAQFERTFTQDVRWSDYQLDAQAFRAALDAAAPGSIGEALKVFYGMYADRFGKPAWGDKSPRTLSIMGALSRELPEACFIHIIRDGRDVAVSSKGRWWVEGADYVELLGTWVAEIEEARAEAARAGSRYMEVRYEHLVTEPEATLKAICAFIGYPYEPGMLDYAATAATRHQELHDVARGPGTVLTREERIAKHEMTTKAPTSERIGRWRTAMSPSEVRACEVAAGHLLAELGYELATPPASPLHRTIQAWRRRVERRLKRLTARPGPPPTQP